MLSQKADTLEMRSVSHSITNGQNLLSQRKKPGNQPALFPSLRPPSAPIVDHSKQHLSPFLPAIHQMATWTPAQLYDLPDEAELFKKHFVFEFVRVGTRQFTFVNTSIVCMYDWHTNLCWVCTAFVVVSPCIL